MNGETETNGHTEESAAVQYDEKVKANSSWITKEMLQEVLCEHENNNDLRVTDCQVSAAVGAGDNYLSIIYKTTVEYVRKESGEVETKHLIIKGSPTAKFLIQFIEEVGIFRKELSMYYDCLPAMKRLVHEYFPEDTMFLAADAYRCSLPNTIVLEDLTVSGYKMANRRNQLDFSHCITTLRSLARFHALSAKIMESNPDIIEAVSTEFYQECNRAQMSPYLDKCFPTLAEEVEGWGEHARLGATIRDLGRRCYDKMLHMVKPTPGSLSVLNHGDFWVNNMMYKYDSQGNVIHAKLVDFQLARYTSPAMDLLYFLFSSPQPKVLSESMFELVESYHEALTTDMERLGVDCSVLSLEQLHEEMLDRCYFGLVVLATILPIIVAKPADAMDLDTFDPETVATMDEFPLARNYRDPLYRETGGKFLEQLDKIGYLTAAKERMQHVEEAADAADNTAQ